MATILVIGDSVSVRQRVFMTLQKAGYDVVEAAGRAVAHQRAQG